MFLGDGVDAFRCDECAVALHGEWQERGGTVDSHTARITDKPLAGGGSLLDILFSKRCSPGPVLLSGASLECHSTLGPRTSNHPVVGRPPSQPSLHQQAVTSPP